MKMTIDLFKIMVLLGTILSTLIIYFVLRMNSFELFNCALWIMKIWIALAIKFPNLWNVCFIIKNGYKSFWFNRMPLIY